MDRLAQTALSAIRQMRDNKFDLAHNLSNVNVPGFRRDLPNEGNAAFLKELDKVSAKVLPLEVDRRSFSNEAGPLQNTGLATDVAVLNEGFFFIAPENGEIALSRRGDFGIDALNQLVNLITSQRNYQAAAKAIETSSSMTQTIINIRS